MRRAIGWVFALLIGSSWSCSTERGGDTSERITGRTMGTSFSLQIVGSTTPQSRAALQQDVLARLSTLNEHFSTYQATSELSRINASRTRDWLSVSPLLCEVLEDALSLAADTDGAFDVALGSLVELWGFGAASPLSHPPPAERVEAALASSGHRQLEVDCSKPALRKHHVALAIDLSAYAKGYAVDELDSLLRSSGRENYLIEIGGELLARGTNAQGERWGVAVERPAPTGRPVQTVLRVHSPAGVATSGDYRNYFEHDGTRYSHTLDPKTGWPVTHSAASVTVVARSAARADALATALLVLGPDRGLQLAEQRGIAAYFLVREGDALVERYSSHLERRVEFGQ